jgi:hypothetical protein
MAERSQIGPSEAAAPEAKAVREVTPARPVRLAFRFIESLDLDREAVRRLVQPNELRQPSSSGHRRSVRWQATGAVRSLAARTVIV